MSFNVNVFPHVYTLMWPTYKNVISHVVIWRNGERGFLMTPELLESVPDAWREFYGVVQKYYHRKWECLSDQEFSEFLMLAYRAKSISIEGRGD